LEREKIRSWEELTKQFTSNFKSTYKRPASIEEVKACVQQRNESLRSYIQRWSDKGMTPRVLTFSIPAIGQERSPLEEYMKPARPNTPTWSRRKKLFVNPNWLHI
jgi:hypothetical protein